MFNLIKEKIQERMLKKCVLSYDKEVQRQQDPYTQWIALNEPPAVKNRGKKDLFAGYCAALVFYEDCKGIFDPAQISGIGDTDYIVFAKKEGALEEWALKKIFQKMKEESEILIVYGNEDYYDIKQSRKRTQPWFKPDWSPDTLLSFFYFGAAFVVRTKQALNIPWSNSMDPMQNIYDFVLKYTENLEDKKIFHMEAVLFHNDKLPVSKLPAGAGKEFDEVKLSALKRRGIRGGQCSQVFEEKEGKEPLLCTALAYEPLGEPLVSIIIPSKDNADILKNCILSILKNTVYQNIEIIVVDNGSNGDTKKSLEALRADHPFQYLYKKLEFNFSLMCNMGVKEAKGSFLLFMNDDIEVPENAVHEGPDWMSRMLGQAALPHTGAVGVKLLYPWDDPPEYIQHVGVTNLGVGPAHKLGGLSDKFVYYHGQNRLVYDMIGVTAACLMVEKAKFLKAGGFSEELKVAYNDVDFCMTLYEHGFHNVQRNDIRLFHYESLSRGDDRAEEGKWLRLMAEKDKLYERHPRFEGYDPYYSRGLVSDHPEYFCNYRYEYERMDCVMTPSPYNTDPALWENGCVQPTLEYCASDLQVSNKLNNRFLIEGWVYVLGMDNARYARYLVLKNEIGKMWRVPLFLRIRKDVAEILPEETHVELSGFVCRIEQEALEPGNYSMILCMKDRCSRQTLSAKLDGELSVQQNVGECDS